MGKNVTAKSSDFVVDEETGSAVVHDGAYVTIGGMITEKTVKTTRNNKMMAFLTVEDLAEVWKCWYSRRIMKNGAIC